MNRYIHNIYIALEAIMTNKLKSLLTALGIIFGVAAVISMLAIGKGAQKEILDQIKLVGVNNIIIMPKIEDVKESDSDAAKTPKKFSRGLSLMDVKSIKEVLPSVNIITPVITVNSHIVKNGKRKPSKVTGVSQDFFEIFNYKIIDGNVFNNYQAEHGLPVCIIGSEIKSRFFSGENPIGKRLKCGKEWLTVIGILEKQNIINGSTEDLGISNIDKEVYIPVKTMLLRYKNRSLVTAKMIEASNNDDERSSSQKKNNNQLDKIVVQITESSLVEPSTKIISKILKRNHSRLEDYEIKVPEMQLKQQQKTKDIFNFVLLAIAAISLIVGGIGIMNIMLASVMERTKEIGTRLAIGAKKKDIIIQFLAESTLISVIGGFIGIVLGLFLTRIITNVFEILTIVSPLSVIIAFGVSAGVGILFGYLPSKKAAEKEPIESLRYE